MTLKRITTRYLQSHREVTIELPERGLIGFYGDNSSGKSVIVRATQDIVQNNITRPKCRKSLVNRDSGTNWGEIEYERYDGMIFKVHIHIEAAQTWYELWKPGDEKPNRAYLSYKALPAFVEEFGFHYMKDDNMSLNICDADDAVLFFNTPHKLNFRVLDSALNDASAQRSLINMQETFKNAQSSKQMFKHQVEVCDAAIKGLKLWDVQKEQEKKDLLTYLCSNLEKIYVPNIPDLPDLPDVSVIDLERPNIPDLIYPEIYDFSIDLPDLVTVGEEMESLRQGICPTCGHHFIEGEE